MKMFQCTYLGHENEEIIGFCLNQKCQNLTQYCYQCLMKIHSDHQSDCVRFVTINQYINEFIQNQKESMNQFQEIYNKMKNSIEQIIKKMDQEIKILENMNQNLSNQDYLVFKSQLNLIKPYYSKEKGKQLCIHFSDYNRKTNNTIQQNQINIIEFNNIFQTIEKFVPDQIKQDHQPITATQKPQINQEVDQLREQENQQQIQKSKQLFDEGKSLF